MSDQQIYKTDVGSFKLVYSHSETWTATWLEQGWTCHVPSRTQADALRKNPQGFGALSYRAKG